MSKINSIKINTLWMFIGNFLYALSQWIQLSLINKKCSISEVGNFTFSLAITAPIFMFLAMQLSTVLITDYKSKYKFYEFLSFRIVASSIGIIIVLVYSIIIESKIIIFVAMLKFLENISEIFNAFQQKNENTVKVAFSLILKSLSITFSMIIGLYFFNSLTLSLILSIFLILLIIIFNDYKNYNEKLNLFSHFYKNIINFREILKITLPLGIVMLIISINSNVSKYYVEYFFGTEQQGVFSTLTYCLVLGGFVNSAIGQTLTPRLNKYYFSNNLKEFYKLSIIYIFINISLGLFLYLFSILFGEIFLELMFSKHISTYNNLFSKIMLLGCLIYVASSLGYILSSMKIFKIQPFINGIVMISNVIIGYFLIKRYQLDGLIISMMITSFIQILLTLIIILNVKNKSWSFIS